MIFNESIINVIYVNYRKKKKGLKHIEINDRYGLCMILVHMCNFPCNISTQSTTVLYTNIFSKKNSKLL